MAMKVWRASLRACFVTWKRNGVCGNGLWWNFRTRTEQRSVRGGAGNGLQCGWSQIHGFGHAAVSKAYNGITAMVEALEYRIRAAVNRNCKDFQQERHEQFIAALKSDNMSLMHKACGGLKKRPKQRTKRLKDPEGGDCFQRP